MKKVWLTVLVVFLAALMVLLPACENQPNGNETATGEQTANNSSTTEEVTEYDPMKVTPTADYNYADFVIISPSRTWAETKMTAETLTAEVINDAIYRRTAKVEEKLKIVIKDNIVADVNNIAKPALISGVGEGEGAFDLLQVWPSVALTMYQEGLYVDQKKISTMDMQNPWWEHSFNDQVNIGDATYISYNQSSLILYSGFYIFVFNKSLVKSYNLTDPYDLVDSDEWTWENAYSMMRQVKTDEDNDGTPETADHDKFGIVGHVNHVQNLVASSGQTILVRDADGNLPTKFTKVSDSFSDAFAKYIEYFVASESAAIADMGSGEDNDFNGYTTSSGLPNYIAYFNDGNSLFLTTGTSEVTRIREGNVDYGIVVVPKYDAEQRDYITPVYNKVDGFAVPRRSGSEEVVKALYDRVGVVMDNLGAASYNYLVDEHIGTVLYYRVANDPTARDMIEKAYSNPVIDVAYSNDFGSCAGLALAQVKSRNGTTIGTKLADLKKKFNMDLTKALAPAQES